MSLYYSVDESIKIANKLLLHQYNDDDESVRNFLQILKTVVDSNVVRKMNTIAIIAPPSSGKTYFFDAVCSFFLNYGAYGTANKTNNFCWADGAGKKLILWNEPNYEQFSIDKMKEILGGDTTRVNVKYQGEQTLQGPPVIMTSNVDLSVCRDPAFRDRVTTFYWHPAPFLKDYNKKLNPLFFFDLLLHWDIIENNLHTV